MLYTISVVTKYANKVLLDQPSLIPDSDLFLSEPPPHVDVWLVRPADRLIGLHPFISKHKGLRERAVPLYTYYLAERYQYKVLG